MADRGIIFSAPMVRALVDGRKTQTRRLLRPPAWAAFPPEYEEDERGINTICEKTGCFAAVPAIPRIGEQLYVREAWSHTGQGVWDVAAARMVGRSGVIYRAEGAVAGAKYWPSIHMPREFSRLTLTVTDVRAQRLQEISEADAEAEGCVWDSADGHDVWYVPGAQTPRNGATAAECFSILWKTLHTKPGQRWEDNPWIYGLTFDVRHENIDAMHEGAA